MDRDALKRQLETAEERARRLELDLNKARAELKQLQALLLQCRASLALPGSGCVHPPRSGHGTYSPAPSRGRSPGRAEEERHLRPHCRGGVPPANPAGGARAVGWLEYEAGLHDWEARRLVFDATRKVGADKVRKAIRTGKGDAAALARQALGEDDDPAPVRRRYLTQDATVEKLGELLRENPRGLLVSRDELVGLLRTLDREDRGSDRAFYLEAWNGTGRFTWDRISRGTVEVEAACVAVLGSIQPGPLGEYLRGAVDGGRGDDGLLQRFQLVAWPDVHGEWQDVDRWPDGEARTRAYATFERLDGLDAAGLGAEPGREGDIPCLRLDDGALEAFVEWRTRLEGRLRAGEDLPALEAHLAKYRSLVPSLALLTHLADAPQGGAVGEVEMLRALAWADYLESHARRLYAPAVRLETEGARELIRHIRRGDLPDPFLVRDVYRKGWRGLDRDGATRAAELLEDLSWLRSETVETPDPLGRGRPTVRYHVNPKAREVVP